MNGKRRRAAYSGGNSAALLQGTGVSVQNATHAETAKKGRILSAPRARPSVQRRAPGVHAAKRQLTPQTVAHMWLRLHMDYFARITIENPCRNCKKMHVSQRKG